MGHKIRNLKNLEII